MRKLIAALLFVPGTLLITLSALIDPGPTDEWLIKMLAIVADETGMKLVEKDEK